MKPHQNSSFAKITSAFFHQSHHNNHCETRIPTVKHKTCKSFTKSFQDGKNRNNNYIAFRSVFEPKRTSKNVKYLTQVLQKKIRAHTIEDNFDKSNYELDSSIREKQGFWGGKVAPHRRYCTKPERHASMEQYTLESISKQNKNFFQQHSQQTKIQTLSSHEAESSFKNIESIGRNYQPPHYDCSQINIPNQKLRRLKRLKNSNLNTQISNVREKKKNSIRTKGRLCSFLEIKDPVERQNSVNLTLGEEKLKDKRKVIISFEEGKLKQSLQLMKKSNIDDEEEDQYIVL